MARYTQTPAKWYAELVRARRAAESRDDFTAAEKIEKAAASEERYLKDSIKLLRKFVKGFEASDGFDLTKVKRIPQSQINRIKKYAPILRQETGRVIRAASGQSVEYFKVVRPRSARGRRAVEQFTGQTDIPKRKGYVVPVDKPDKKVRLVTKKVIVEDSLGRKRHARQEQIEVTHTKGTKKYYDRYFRFPERPHTFEHIIQMTRELLPYMPKGWYVIETSNYGAIGDFMRKEDIIRVLVSRYVDYDKIPAGIGQEDNRGLAKTVVGYRLTGHSEGEARREYDARFTRMEKAARWRKSKARQQLIKKHVGPRLQGAKKKPVRRKK